MSISGVQTHDLTKTTKLSLLEPQLKFCKWKDSNHELFFSFLIRSIIEDIKNGI